MPAPFKPALLLEIADGTATVTISNPAKRNAMTPDMWRALPAMLGGLARDPAVRVLVLVLTGAGDTFCAGADISGLRADADTWAMAGPTTTKPPFCRWWRPGGVPSRRKASRPRHEDRLLERRGGGQRGLRRKGQAGHDRVLDERRLTPAAAPGAASSGGSRETRQGRPKGATPGTAGPRSSDPPLWPG